MFLLNRSLLKLNSAEKYQKKTFRAKTHWTKSSRKLFKNKSSDCELQNVENYVKKNVIRS